MNSTDMTDDLRPEYNLSELLKGGVRGKYADRYQAGTNLVRLEPDVANAFPTENAVNEALRLVMKMAQLPINLSQQCSRRSVKDASRV